MCFLFTPFASARRVAAPRICAAASSLAEPQDKDAGRLGSWRFGFQWMIKSAHFEDGIQNGSMRNRARNPHLKWWQLALLLALLPIIVVLAVPVFALFILTSVGLRLVIWSWCPRGRDILFIYSENPIWQDHIETRILPRLAGCAVVINCSRRKRRPFSVARIAFHHFGGHSDFNPMAIVFRPFGRTRIYRFWQPFRELKHGRPEAFQRMEAEFYRATGIQPPPDAGPEQTPH